MAHIVLFHSALGLRPGVQQFAEKMREAGHTVTTPDFYNGETFEDYEKGNAKWFSIGVPAILQQAQARIENLKGGLVFAGFSNGAAVAEFLAAAHPHAKGILLMHGALPLEMLQIPSWPSTVSVQLHYSVNDPFRNSDNDASFEKAVKASGASFTEFLYDGKAHLFTDPDLNEFDEAAAKLLLKRALNFVDKL